MALLATIAGCSLFLPTPACVYTGDDARLCEQVWVGVTGPADWMAPDDYILEVGGSAWPIESLFGGGVISLDVAGPVSARLVRPSDCAVLVSWVARPGTAWAIRFDADDQPRLEDWTGQGLESGPALGEGLPSGCP